MQLAHIIDGCPLGEIDRCQFRPDQIAQEKIDGRRAWIDSDSKLITGRNSPFGVFRGELPPGCIFDGELVGETFHAFDLLKYRGQEIKAEPLGFRLHLLDGLAGDFLHVRRSESIFELARQIDDEGGEGIVVKGIDSTYLRGGWTRFKREFTREFMVLNWCPDRLSCEVCDQTGASVGRVNGAKDYLAPGTIIEVRAMQFTADGKLRHARMVRVRDDLTTLSRQSL